MAEIQRPKGGPLAKLAGLWANEPEFLNWMHAIGQPANTPDDAAEFIRARCGIESRAFLDHDPRAKRQFHRYILGPYSKHRAAAGLQ